MLFVNVIEFNGRKAVINSYSNHPLLIESMNRQLAEWRARYPKASVETLRMTESETVALVAQGQLGPLRSLSHEIGRESEA